MSNEKQYKALLEEISGVYESASLQSRDLANDRLVKSYWRIGKLIVDIEKERGGRGVYGDGLLRRLSDDLNARFVKGFSIRNLRYMRLFREEYKMGHICAALGWSHYRALLSVEDPSERSRLEALVIDQNLSNSQLVKLIAQSKNNKENMGIERLKVPEGRLYLYKVALNIRTRKHVVDCGFDVLRDVPFSGVKNLRSGMILESKKKGRGFGFVPMDTVKGRKERYSYMANLVRVVDGDTLLVQVDLGFNTFIRQRLRLRGIDAPEITTDAGKEAYQFVNNQLSRVGKIAIKTYGFDKYGRRLVDVMHKRGESDHLEILKNGNFLNQTLLDEGLVFKT